MKEIFVRDYARYRLLNLKSLILRKGVKENVGPVDVRRRFNESQFEQMTLMENGDMHIEKYSVC
jgi:hypothetical protein